MALRIALRALLANMDWPMASTASHASLDVTRRRRGLRGAFHAPLARTAWAGTTQRAATAAAVLVASAKLARIGVSIAQKVNIKQPWANQGASCVRPVNIRPLRRTYQQQSALRVPQVGLAL